jgi:hypothetical protein
MLSTPTKRELGNSGKEKLDAKLSQKSYQTIRKTYFLYLQSELKTSGVPWPVHAALRM